MTDLVTLLAVLTCAHNMTRLTAALARRLESPVRRAWTISSYGDHPRRYPAQQRDRRRGR